MRVIKPFLSRQFNPAPSIRHDSLNLTGFAGIVLFSAYLNSVGVIGKLREKSLGLPKVGDYPVFSILLLLLLFIAGGGERPAHLAYFSSDALLARMAWLKRIPSSPTISRFFALCRKTIVKSIVELNIEFVIGCIHRLGVCGTLTLDLDGTVVSTRGHQERTRKGYNPIRRGARSYRPLTVHLAELGQFLTVTNRPGNVPDNDAAVSLMRKVIRRLKSEFPGVRIRVRQDSAFFDNKLLRMYEAEGVRYVVVAKMYEDLSLIVKNRKRWTEIRDGVDAFEFCWKMKSWSDARDFAAYRFRLSEKEITKRKGEQLDLFRPNDPEYRYMLFCHDFPHGEVPLEELHTFYAGRCGQEKDIGELKSGFFFDVLPSRKYSANSLWQQLAVLAYNTMVGFATEVVCGAERRPATAKVTRLFTTRTAQTLRFLHICVPGQLINDSGRSTLRLPESRARRTDWDRFSSRIQKIETRRNQKKRRQAA